MAWEVLTTTAVPDVDCSIERSAPAGFGGQGRSDRPVLRLLKRFTGPDAFDEAHDHASRIDTRETLVVRPVLENTP